MVPIQPLFLWEVSPFIEPRDSRSLGLNGAITVPENSKISATFTAFGKLSSSKLAKQNQAIEQLSQTPAIYNYKINMCIRPV